MKKLAMLLCLSAGCCYGMSTPISSDAISAPSKTAPKSASIDELNYANGVSGNSEVASLAVPESVNQIVSEGTEVSTPRTGCLAFLKSFTDKIATHAKGIVTTLGPVGIVGSISTTVYALKNLKEEYPDFWKDVLISSAPILAGTLVQTGSAIIGIVKEKKAKKVAMSSIEIDPDSYGKKNCSAYMKAFTDSIAKHIKGIVTTSGSSGIGVSIVGTFGNSQTIDIEQYPEFWKDLGITTGPILATSLLQLLTGAVGLYKSNKAKKEASATVGDVEVEVGV